MENAADTLGIEHQKVSMCEVATVYSASKTLMFMRCDQVFDDEGAPGLKTPSLTLTPDPARDWDQDQDQALRYALP